MKETFRQFLVGYVSAGHTVDESIMDELRTLSDEFVQSIYPGYYFTSNATDLFIEFLNERLSDENRHWFPLRFNEERYIDMLENWIKYIINDKSIDN